MKKLILFLLIIFSIAVLAACSDPADETAGANNEPADIESGGADSAEKITVGGKEYEAVYFGEQDLTAFNLGDYASREYWRLENAYDDFKDRTIISNLPYHNYPMEIETGQVFVIDYTLTDGSVERKYYRSDGTTFQDNPSTVEFIP